MGELEKLRIHNLQMRTIYSIIKDSRAKNNNRKYKLSIDYKRRVNFISIRKLKFYTKETLKFFNIALISLGFIIAIILIKYKPMYEVKISGEQVGYVHNKEAFNEVVEESIEKYSNKNIDKIELTENPEYEFKLVEKTKESNENEIIIALQRTVEVTYKYYELAFNEESIEQVDTLENAKQIASDIEEITDKEIILTVNERITKDIEQLNIKTVDVAKTNIIETLDIDTTEEIAKVNGIKIATLPITGRISSRYGVSSSIRSSTHTGLDIQAAQGTPIKAIANGTVIHAAKTGAYGYLVKIDHGNGVETWYAHTSKMYVTPGQKVKAGDIIALVGSTGNSTGPHLHLEIRINGRHVNPQKYLYN